MKPTRPPGAASSQWRVHRRLGVRRALGMSRLPPGASEARCSQREAWAKVGWLAKKFLGRLRGASLPLGGGDTVRHPRPALRAEPTPFGIGAPRPRGPRAAGRANPLRGENSARVMPRATARRIASLYGGATQHTSATRDFWPRNLGPITAGN